MLWMLPVLLISGTALGEETAEPGAPTPAAPAPQAEEPVPTGFRGPARGAGKIITPAAYEEAKRLFQEGVSLFQQGRLGSARARFADAYQLTGEPDLLYNLALVSTELDRPLEAIRYYERYLQAHPDAKERTEIELERVTLRRRAAALQRIETEEAARRRQEAEARSPKRAPPAPPLRPRAPLALLGAGGVVLLAGLACSFASVGIGASINGSDRYDAGLDTTGRGLGSAGIALDVIGGAALAAGGTWLLVQRRGRAERISLAPRGLGFTLSGSF